MNFLRLPRQEEETKDRYINLEKVSFVYVNPESSTGVVFFHLPADSEGQDNAIELRFETAAKFREFVDNLPKILEAIG